MFVISKSEVLKLFYFNSETESETDQLILNVNLGSNLS